MSIDLKPYGFDWTINSKNAEFMPSADLADSLNLVNVVDSIYYFASGSVYNIIKMQGRGLFGQVLLCTRVSDGREFVIKEISNANLDLVVKESIIQIILEHTTKGINHPDIELSGPYVPRFIEFGYYYSPTGLNCCIVSEKMENTLLYLIEKIPKDRLNSLLPKIFIQISTIISDLSNILQFNHRDFKTDNCMFIQQDDGTLNMRIIDFGLSCIKWGKITINSDSGEFKHCTLPTRDLTQLMFEILHYYEKILPEGIINILKKVLTFKIKGETCQLYRGCDGFNIKKEDIWDQTYTYLNDESILNPNCDALVLKKIWIEYKPERPIICPEGKIYNPKSKRCVNINGALGKKLQTTSVKICPEKKPDYNPKTKRCVLKCKANYHRDEHFKCIKTRKGPSKL